MNQPTVVAVCLTADRPEMTRQAVASFRAQTYDPAKRFLIVYDTSEFPQKRYGPSDAENEDYIEANSHTGFDTSEDPIRRSTIGELRNEAIGELSIGDTAAIICHWDSDDWSHPNRIAEQVALLQSSGAECVGFNEMLFWREPTEVYNRTEAGVTNRGIALGEAWLYTNRSATWALGTSLCYWRKTWDRAPFAAMNSGEDTEWFNRVKCAAVSSIGVLSPVSYWGKGNTCCWYPRENTSPDVEFEPRMVARIHAGNAQNVAYWPAEMAKAAHHWRRVPEWDEYCKGVFAK